MELTWKQRLIWEPEWHDFQRWPSIDTHGLSREHCRQFQRNARAVSAVLVGEKLCDVGASLSISNGRVSQLMARCLAGPDDQPPMLTRGLIPYQHQQFALRKQAIDTLTQPMGHRCSFAYVLDTAPGLRDHLIEHIRLSVNRSRRGQNLRPGPLHAQFIAFLEALDWPHDQYPFTTVSRGYESIRRYLELTIADFLMPRESTRVTRPEQTPFTAFQEIQIDEAHLDCHGAAAVVLRHRMKPVRLGRVSLLLARDVGTGCYLAATIALTSHPTALDVLALLEQLTQPWQPLELVTPGLSYCAEAGFPSAIDETFCRPAFGLIRFDNALAHLSHQVRRMVCDHLTGTCNFGLPKNPKARAFIEQAFRRLNVDIHRFPSTTGSHPADPLREPAKLQKEPPYVSLRALEEAVSILLVEYNHRPLANQGGITPMEQMHYQMANHFLILRATSLAPGLKPFELAKSVTVRRGFTADAPRINFAGCQYTGKAINQARLLNRKVTIVYDARDIRYLRVQTLAGEPLGTVNAPGSWLRYAHSIAVRKRVIRLVREHILSRRDPLGGYYEYTRGHAHLPSKALEYLKLTEASRPLGDSDASHKATPSTEKTTPNDRPDLQEALKRVPDWSPDMAKKRR